MKEMLSKLKYILRYIKPFNLLFCFVSYFILIGSVFQLSSAFLQQTIINVIDESSINIFEKTITYSTLLIFSAIILLYMGGLIKDIYIRRLENELLENVFKDFNKIAYEQIEKFHSGDLVMRLKTNSHAFISAFQTIVFQLASNLVLFIASFLYLSSIQLALALLILLSGVISLLVGRFFDPRLKRTTNVINEKGALIRVGVQEIVNNIEIIKTYECENYIINKDEAMRNEQLKHLNRKALLSAGLWNSLLAINDGFMIVAAFVLCVISIKRDAYLGSLIAFINLIGRVQWPFIDMSNMIASLHQDIISANRAIEIIQLENTQEGETAGKDDAVVCSNVSYSYDKDRVLCDINLRIKSGMKIGITGKSGSGKSTFAKLCAGLYTADDGIVQKRKTAYFAQFPHLFNATVLENIHIGNIACSDDEVKDAIEHFLIFNFISEFDDGWEHIIREGSTNLSGGQSQRIALARSVLCEAEVIILDEITASLDVETEKKFLALIDELYLKKTLIFVTHRKNVLEKMDDIILFDDGKIVANGTHRDLLKNEIYTSLLHEKAGE